MIPHAINNHDQKPFVPAVIAFTALLVTTVILWLLTSTLGSTDLQFLDDPLQWLRLLESQAAFDTLGNAAEVVAAVLAIAITVVAIIVELAANRYSHLITRLFIHEPLNLVVLGLFVVTTLQCVWTAATLTEPTGTALLPQAGFAITMALVTVSLLSLLPYIYFVFSFLSPISIINRISRNAFNIIRKARPARIELAQRNTLNAIDELQDVCRGAIQGGDRGIAMSGISALTALLYDYSEIRSTLPDNWYTATPSVAQDADFVALAKDSLNAIEEQQIWLETKIFRQFFSLMTQCAGNARDVANLIGINTQQIAKDLGTDNPYLLTLCIKSFNSYLRTTINAKDARTAYYLMNQYRILAEHLLAHGKRNAVLEIAGHFREYGQIAHKNGISFLLEAASYDVVQLIEHALEIDSDGDIVDELLDVLLELDQEIKEESQEDSLLGVRRSQIQLATYLLQHGHTDRARRIATDLREEKIERLERLRETLLADNRPDYWELMDRGANFSYLPPDQHEHLEVLFDWLRAGKWDA